MKRIKRENVAAKYGPCVECGIGTRSHVLEAAEWEEYEEEVVVARSDDFASTAWEEVDTARGERDVDNLSKFKSWEKCENRRIFLPNFLLQMKFI